MWEGGGGRVSHPLARMAKRSQHPHIHLGFVMLLREEAIMSCV